MNVDCDESVKFQFNDLVKGYVELDLSEQQETPHKGWTIKPRMEPLRVSIVYKTPFIANVQIYKKKEFPNLCQRNNNNYKEM